MMQISPVWCFLPVISAAFPLVACADAWRIVLPVLHVAVTIGCAVSIAMGGNDLAVPVLLVISGAISLLACFAAPARPLPRYLAVMAGVVLAFLSGSIGVLMLVFRS